MFKIKYINTANLFEKPTFHCLRIRALIEYCCDLSLYVQIFGLGLGDAKEDANTLFYSKSNWNMSSFHRRLELTVSLKL
jgi:hypothetical protein